MFDPWSFAASTIPSVFGLIGSLVGGGQKQTQTSVQPLFQGEEQAQPAYKPSVSTSDLTSAGAMAAQPVGVPQRQAPPVSAPPTSSGGVDPTELQRLKGFFGGTR